MQTALCPLFELHHGRYDFNVIFRLPSDMIDNGDCYGIIPDSGALYGNHVKERNKVPALPYAYVQELHYLPFQLRAGLHS